MEKKTASIIILAILLLISVIYGINSNVANIRTIENFRQCDELVRNCPLSQACKQGEYGYLEVYDWIDGWSKNCQRDDKIFTVESDENGTLRNVRCAIEQKP